MTRYVLGMAMLTMIAGCWHGDAHVTPPPAAARVAEPAVPPPIAGPGDHLSADSVLERISAAYAPQVRRCYRQLLKRDGNAQGKVILTFDVDETGHLINGRAEGMAAQVTTCITRRMSEWTFVPPSASDPASFQIPMKLLAN